MSASPIERRTCNGCGRYVRARHCRSVCTTCTRELARMAGDA